MPRTTVHNGKQKVPNGTVVIPAYNAEDTISKTIKSVADVVGWPVVVVDDGSNDKTSMIAEQLGARVILQRNQGASIARAVGLGQVETELVIFLDSDDELLPGARAAAARLHNDPEAGVVGGIIVPNTASRKGLIQPRRNLPEQLSTSSLLSETFAPWPQSAAIWRRSCLERARDLDLPPLNPRYAEDFEMLLRTSLVAKVLSIQECTCLHRLAGGKSATHAVEAVRQSERIRSYYSAYLDVSIYKLTDAAIKDQARWRQFRALQSQDGLVNALIKTFTNPGQLLGIIRHRARRATKGNTDATIMSGSYSAQKNSETGPTQGL